MKGFTLLEITVVMAIMSILSAIILIGWPRTRQHQALLLAAEQVQTTLRTAQQKALNEDRHPDCLRDWVGSSPEEQRLCSDIGVAVQESTIVIFADTNIPTVNQYEETKDFPIEQQTLPLGVTGPSSWQSFVFEASPPNIELVGGAPRTLRLKSGTAARDLVIKSYGQVE